MKIGVPILDACCGGRYFHFQKDNPNVLFLDNRICEKGHSKWRPQHSVKPDILGDFRNLDFPDNRFKLVIFDPPHLTSAGPQGDMGKRYGRLDRKNWRDDIAKGLGECWRVLDNCGTLIFKWSEVDIPLKQLEPLFPAAPLIGHRTGKENKTIWVIFFKVSQ